MELDALLQQQPAAQPQQAAQAAPAEDNLSKLIEWFESAEEATDHARKVSEQCRDYYDGRQLTSQELAELRKRGQPDIIINRIQPKIDYLLGY